MAEQVLVVDDDPATASLVRDTLAGAGYRVTVAGDGQQCLRALALGQPDLVILDVMLPGMNGLAVLAMIRNQQETQDLPVIMLSARDRHDDKLWGQMGGASRYITKPFQPDALVEAVRQVLGEHEAVGAR